MAKFTRKQFAEIIGKDSTFVGTYIKRGKIIEKDKRINLDNPTNKVFLAKYTTQDAIKATQEDNIDEQIDTSNSVDDSEIDLPSDSNSRSRTNIDYTIKLHKLEESIVKIKKENLDYDKKKGNLVELKPVSEVMQRAVVALSSKYTQQSKLFIVELAAKYGIPEIEIASVQKSFDERINLAVKESRELIVDECKSVANEYASSLRVGESK